jgi:hypothetical protein
MNDISRETARVHLLSNGDVFEVGTIKMNFHFEYEDGFFYEVIEDGLDEFGQTKWKRIGAALTGNQVNELTFSK